MTEGAGETRTRLKQLADEIVDAGHRELQRAAVRRRDHAAIRAINEAADWLRAQALLASAPAPAAERVEIARRVISRLDVYGHTALPCGTCHRVGCIGVNALHELLVALIAPLPPAEPPQEQP